jgi:dTDP-4-amino-4,6-dideoxygalactose transaminase
VIKEPAGAKATYPYLTLVFDDRQKRKKALQLFENSGLGVSQIYTSAVNGYDYLKGVIQEKEFPSASYLANRHITLSTSIFISENEMEKAVRICRRI